jgi:hypothetical protein
VSARAFLKPGWGGRSKRPLSSALLPKRGAFPIYCCTR